MTESNYLRKNSISNKSARKLISIPLREFIVEFAIIINPVIDILFNLFKGLNLAIPINQVARIAIFMVSAFCLQEKKSFRNIFFLICLLAFSTAMQYAVGLTYSLFSDIAFIVKIISAYTMYRLLMEILIKNPDYLKNVLKACFISFIIIMLNIFLAVLGFGSRTYSESTDRLSGYIGFLSGNCITANCLMMLLIFNMIYFGKRKLFVILLNIISLLLLATKFSIFGTGAIILMIILYEIYASPKKVRGKRFLLFLVLSILCCVIAYPFLKVYIEKLFVYGNKYGWNLFELITSNRGLQINIVKDYYVSSLNKNQNLIGMLFGYSQSHVNYILHDINVAFEAIEWDFHGVYLYLGGISLAVLIVFLLKMLKHGFYFVRRKNRQLSYLSIVLAVMIISAFLGGHVFYESMTLQYFIVVLAVINSKYYLCKK